MTKIFVSDFSAILNFVTITVSHGTKMSKRASKPWISQYFDCADSIIISEVEGMVRRGTTVEGVWHKMTMVKFAVARG